MQIYEVKNGIAEILYAPGENKLFLSDFLFIEDNEMTIVSQVTDIATTEQADINIATVRFYLSVDKENKLSQYNGHTPSKDSEVGYLDANEIIGLFHPKSKEIIWGSYIRNSELKVSTSLKYLSSKSCIVCDKPAQSVMLAQNLLYSLDLNGAQTVILDFEGKYKNVKTTARAVFGSDYRIPLNSRALDYIFENDLNDCPIDAKVVIQNIILEIQKYVESLEEDFLPFETFLQIIVAECKNSENPGLLIFSNKLMQYKQKKIFADEIAQCSIINDCEGSFMIGISNVDSKYHKLIFESVITALKKKVYVISDISEENVTNDILKHIYDKQNIRLVPIIKHDDKFLNKMKSICNNFVVFAPATHRMSNEPYGSFMENLNQNEFILCGENTLFIPLIVTLKQITKDFQATEQTINSRYEEITFADLDDLDCINNVNIPETEMIVSQEQPELQGAELLIKSEQTEEAIETNHLSTENPSEIVEIIEDTELEIQKNHIPEVIESVDEIEMIANTEIPVDTEIVTDIETIADIDKVTDTEIPTDIDMIADIEMVTDTEIPADNAPQIKQNIEFNYAEPVPQSEHQIENIETTVKHVQPVNVGIHQQEQRPQTPPPISSKPVPNADEIPVYETKEVNESNSVAFEEGNRVSHAKYGTGTVEKVIKYGKKTLCSIQFDNVGRRLLDPNITVLERN